MHDHQQSFASRLPTVWLSGVSLIGPGIAKWEDGAAILRGDKAYQPMATQLPVPEMLPGAERRRATRAVKLCLALGLQACKHAGADVSSLPSVFCSSGADGQTTHAICDTLSTAEPMVSPTRFHNSVHNAAAGYWSIAAQCMAPSQVICAHDATFAAGLIEAIVQVHAYQAQVLLIAFDGDYPEPLLFCRSIGDMGGIGLVLSPEKPAQALASLSLELTSAETAADSGSGACSDAPFAIADLTLDKLGQQIPALAGLSLLKYLADEAAGTATLPYLPGLKVRVDIQPCVP